MGPGCLREGQSTEDENEKCDAAGQGFKKLSPMYARRYADRSTKRVVGAVGVAGPLPLPLTNVAAECDDRLSSAGGEGGTMMGKPFAVASVGVLLLMTLVVASSAGAAPLVDRFHGTFSETNPDDSLCGISGSSVTSGMDNIQVFADGTFQDEFRLTYVFTAENGKSVELFIANQFTGTGPTDNGDGTVTFTSTYKGIPEEWKIANGPTLIIDVGFVTFTDVVNLATGDVTTTIDPENGPHPELDSDFTLLCSVLVPALT